MQSSARHLVRLALVLLFPVAAMGCSGSTSAPEDDGDPVSFDRLTSHFPAVQSGITEGENLVIRDQESWTAFWDRFRTGTETATPPQVSFQERMVLVMALGTRNTGGYSVEINRVRAMDDGTLNVVGIESIPGENCSTTQALTYPVDAVLVARTEGEVHFEAEASVYRCEDEEDDGDGPSY